MKVTVCQLSDDRSQFQTEWDQLVRHVKDEGSDLVVLPEMPFSSWFATDRIFVPAVWKRVVEEHEAWLPRIAELEPAATIGTRPANAGDSRINEGFIWHTYFDKSAVYQLSHDKHYLPDEEGYWEASWYHSAAKRFQVSNLPSYSVGMLICSELWWPEYARGYSKQGVQLIACPRCTGPATLDKWLVGGQAAAIISGAFCLSSNRSGPLYGGQGWIIDPDGTVLAKTSVEQPVITLSIELSQADNAKYTYPRNISD